MTFTDSYERSIDAKGRLQIPSQLREIMESANQGRILYLVPGARSGTLALYPAAKFEQMAQYMDNAPSPDDDALTYQQLFYSMASRLEMDKQGRVLLPERMLKRANIGTELMLTGAGGHLDLWNRAVYEEFVENNWGRWAEVQKKARLASRKKTPDGS
jgi:MraZ protein